MAAPSEKEPDKTSLPKLYGMCLAAIPTDDGITISCTPIAVSKGDREHFENLEKLKFNLKWDHTEGYKACFVHIVDTLDRIVKLQQESCAHMGAEYKPVCLYFGDDSRKPVNDIEGIYSAIFSPPLSTVTREPGTPPSELWAKRVSETADPGLAAYLQACEKLPGLLQQCAGHDGRYTPPSSIDERKPSELDEELALLREKINRGEDLEDTHDKIMQIARQRGKDAGRQFLVQPKAFTFVPEGVWKRRADGTYEINPTAEERFPSYTFYGWRPDYRQAFYEGFNVGYDMKKYPDIPYRYCKLATEPSNPPFTDPCADRIMEQFQIIDGIRKPETAKAHQYRDFSTLCEAIATRCDDAIRAVSESPLRHTLRAPGVREGH